MIPEEARWENIRAAAQADDIKIRLDNILRLLEDRFPDDLRGLLPPVYAGSNLDRENVAGLINLFSKDTFSGKYGGEDLLGRVYEYFIGEFASSEGKRGGEYFTPRSIVQMLVAMLEPESGKVFDPCCGSGGMFVQSDLFTHHSGNLSFYGQESKDFTYRLCRMNLFIHGLHGDIRLGNSYSDDKHADLRADFILANPPFNDGAKGENGWGADKIPTRTRGCSSGAAAMPLSARNANTMWIMHFLHHLREGGTAGFVMATGELSNSETARLQVRQALVEHDRWTASCSSPGNCSPTRKSPAPSGSSPRAATAATASATAGRDPVHRWPQARRVDSRVAQAEGADCRGDRAGGGRLPDLPAHRAAGGGGGFLPGRDAKRSAGAQIRTDAGAVRGVVGWGGGRGGV